MSSNLLETFVIPPRPALLIAMQKELRKRDPDFRKIGYLLRRDPGIAGGLLKRVNSAFYGLRQPITTIEAAITFVGSHQLESLMSSMIAKRMLGGNQMMPRFWDVSEKRSFGMAYLAVQTRRIAPPLANSLGLFCDIGIPLLKDNISDYLQTLKTANAGTDNFVSVEEKHHKISHALIGAKLAQAWGLADEVVLAIRWHHSSAILQDKSVSPTVLRLVAINQIVERAIEEFRRDQGYTDKYSEWEENREHVCLALDLTENRVESLCSDLQVLFAGSSVS